MSGRAGGEGFNVAVVGATGLVGETMITVLEERNFPVKTAVCARQRALAGQVGELSRQAPVGGEPRGL
ncbi:MAG: hypothetical protein WDM77_14195 [Steroidobacteraceae bacterium]